MGYYTNYTLNYTPRAVPVEVIGEAFARLNSENPTAQDIKWETDYVHTLIDGDCEPHKWYSHDEDMKKLSKALPNVLFRLYGVGEEQDDEWVKFYLNGEVEEHWRKAWSPPRLPESMEYTAEMKQEAVTTYTERAEKIKQDAAEAKAKAEQEKREKAAAQIQEIAEKAGIEAIVKGVG